MNTFKPSGRWYIAALTLLLMLLVWDITSRLQGSQIAIAEQFETRFEKDASRREGMRNLLARDVQSAVQLALYRLPELEQVGSDEDRASILQEAFSRIAFSLRNSRYDFFESMLVQETPQGELLLRGRYPSQAALEGVPVSGTLLFAHVDLENVELFESTSEIYEIESDSLLRIAAQQPVLVHTRLIFEGGEGLSRWFMVNRVGIADLHRAIDLIGQQMVGGTTPMRVINVDARTGNCQLVWEVPKGLLDCTEAELGSGLEYRTDFSTETSRALTYSVYQPNDAYKVLGMSSLNVEGRWRVAIPIVLALFLLITTAAYIRYRTTSTDTLRSFADSLMIKDSVNTSIHDVLSHQLEKMSKFAFLMRDGDIPDSERRYFDIAVSEFMQATLSLNTLRLESPPTAASQRAPIEKINSSELVALAQMVLEVSTIDTPVEAKFLNSGDLPATFLGYGFSIQTALVAAVSLSAETTDEGRIEVSLWSEEVDGFHCMNLRIIDTGVGWGLPEDDEPSEPVDDQPTETLEPESSIARRALRACLRHSGTQLILTDESDAQNEYHLRLCNGRAHNDFG